MRNANERERRQSADYRDIELRKSGDRSAGSTERRAVEGRSRELSVAIAASRDTHRAGPGAARPAVDEAVIAIAAHPLPHGITDHDRRCPAC
jgi:hypothetical protein